MKNTLERAEKIMDLYVRPVLEKHFGNIKITRIEDDVLYVKMLGQCATCTSAQFTLQEVVVKEFKQRMPEIKEVVLDNYDKELFDIAMKILNKEIDLTKK